MKKLISLTYLLIALLAISACSTTKKKGEVKGFKKLYHNTTSKFNGYFNAEELMKESMVTLKGMHSDNYNTILSVYDYIEVDDPKAIAADMDKAIEKVSTVATIHDIGNYVDDCYVLIGKAQYLKHDYISAEETFQYFEEVFDPKNPYGRVYSGSKKKRNAQQRKKDLKKERKEKDKERKEASKEREKERDAKKKEREQKDKDRKKEARERKKKAQKSRSRSSKSRSSRSGTRTRKTAEEKAAEKKAADDLKAKQEAAALREKESKEKAKELEKEEYERKKLEENKKKEKTYENEGEGAIFKNKTAYTEGLYWLARTYIETERYSTADYVFKKLDEIDGLTDKLERQIPAARAHYYLKLKEYGSALRYLNEAIEVEKDRYSKGRYAFIRAQIYDRDDNYTRAYEEYQRAKKLSPSDELKFNAELNILKLAFRTGQTSQAKAIKKLEGFLRESKYAEFNDQIYFTIAEIKLSAGDIPTAIANFEQAIASSRGNTSVKLETYYRLAELLYQQEFYTKAKDNYDQCLKMMKKQDSRYKKVERLATHLTEIANNIEKIELQDSLLRLSMLSESELMDIARTILEEEALNPSTPKSGPMDKRSNIITSNRQLGAGRSSFFAYNPITINQGKIEFNRTWGDRVLEDNWRRSLRADATTETDLLEEKEEEVNLDFTDEQLREALKDVPRNDIQKESANKKIQLALFQLGILFRERLRNYERSIESLERLVREYPQFERRDEALFYLYLSYSDLNRMAKVQEVKAKLLSEFPDSKFTKLATDPSYAESLKSSEESIESYYNETYRLFEAGNYQEVIERSAKKNKMFPGAQDYQAKFDMISAMSYGSVEGKERYIKELEQLVRRHPDTPEETRAKEILRFLKGDREAFDAILYDEALDKFTFEPDKLHYVFVVVYDMGQRDFDNAKININKYNKKYHRFDNLKISNIYLNQENKAQIILVRSFKDKDAAMKYYEGIAGKEKEFIGDDKIGFDIFPSTQRNYREVIKQRGITNYRVFFEKNYE